MTAGVQCDNCRRFAPMPANGWLHVVQQGDPSSFLASLTGGGTEVLWSFCTVLCLAQYATVLALVEGKVAGEGPA